MVQEKKSTPYYLKIEEGQGCIFALINGIEFCRMYYSHNNLLAALDKCLEARHTEESVSLLIGELNLNTESEKDEHTRMVRENHQKWAATITQHFTDYLEFSYAEMIQTRIAAGNVLARQDSTERLGGNKQATKREQAEEISNFRTPYIKKQLGVPKGRPSGTRSLPKSPDEQTAIKHDRELQVIAAMLRLRHRGDSVDIKRAVAKEMSHGRGSSTSKLYGWIRAGLDYDFLVGLAEFMFRAGIREDNLDVITMNEYKKMYRKKVG